MSFLKTDVPHSILDHIDVEPTTDLNTGTGLVWDDTKGKFVPKTITIVEPPGSNKQIIFNDNGTWGADSNLTYDKSNQELYINGTIIRNESYVSKYTFSIAANTTIRENLFLCNYSNQSQSVEFILNFYNSQENGSCRCIATVGSTSRPSISVINNYTSNNTNLYIKSIGTDLDTANKLVHIFVDFYNNTSETLTVDLIVLRKTEDTSVSLVANYTTSGITSIYDVGYNMFSFNGMIYDPYGGTLKASNIRATNAVTEVIKIKDANNVTHTLTFYGGILYDYYNDQSSSS